MKKRTDETSAGAGGRRSRRSISILALGASLASLLSATPAAALTFSGSLNIANIGTTGGAVIVKLVGGTDTEGCGGTGTYSLAGVTAQKYFETTYANLLSAYHSGTKVNILLNGCDGTSPRIIGVYTPDFF